VFSDKDDMDMFIMGVLSSHMHNTAMTQTSRHKQQPRQRTRTDYTIFGRLVCKKMFLFMTGWERERRNSINVNCFKLYKILLFLLVKQFISSWTLDR